MLLYTAAAKEGGGSKCIAAAAAHVGIHTFFRRARLSSVTTNLQF